MEWLQLSLIRPNRWNTNLLRPGEMEKLRTEMAESGPEKTPPIIVRPVKDGYEIIDGEQRWCIARELRWKKIKAEVFKVDEDEAKRLCLSYNLLRGRVNWFRLSDLMREDLEKGKDIYSIYGKSLAKKEIKAVLSLGNITPEARKIAEKALHERDDVSLQHLVLLAKFHPRYHKVIAEIIASGVGIPDLKKTLTDTWALIQREEERKKRQERKEGVSEKPEVEERKAERPKPEPSKPEREEGEKPKTGEAGLREVERAEREKAEEAEIEESEEEKAEIMERRIYDAERIRSFIEHRGEILIIDWEKKEVRLRRVVDHQILEEFIPDRAYTLRFKCPIRACSYMHRVDRPITSEEPREEVTVSCRCGWKAVFNFESEKVTEIERP